jgi:ABC-2 type transport system permease protein
MYKILTLLRAQWLAASTYRLSTILSLVGLLATVIPLYFVANALQPMMSESIQGQGEHYFAFVLTGMVAFSFIGVAVSSVPGAIGNGIATGTLEALMGTPTPLRTIVAGLISYQFAWVAIRAALLIVVGSLLGATFVWGNLLSAAGVLLLISMSYLPIGIIAAALVLAFRTSGPLLKGVLTLSTLLGGVYYPTNVIPSWIESLSAAVPLTYGLRALRGILLENAPTAAVLPDVVVLCAFIVVLFAAAAASFSAAFRHAQRTGTLTQY